MKALGTGHSRGVFWTGIEVVGRRPARTAVPRRCGQSLCRARRHQVTSHAHAFEATGHRTRAAASGLTLRRARVTRAWSRGVRTAVTRLTRGSARLRPALITRRRSAIASTRPRPSRGPAFADHPRAAQRSRAESRESLRRGRNAVVVRITPNDKATRRQARRCRAALHRRPDRGPEAHWLRRLGAAPAAAGT